MIVAALADSPKCSSLPLRPKFATQRDRVGLRWQAFVHHIGGLRAMVLPAWSDALTIPYNKALSRGTVKQGDAVSIDKEAKMVTLGSGEKVS